jgi:hypothetical protein
VSGHDDLQTRRPIEKTKDAKGRESYAKEKLAWLMQVARDPAARHALPLAAELALERFNNANGTCNPGDKTLASDLNTTEKTIRRWRDALIEAGYLVLQPRTKGTPRTGTATHVLLIDHRTTLSGGQAYHRTTLSRPPDTQNSQVIEPTGEPVPNQDLNQILREDHAKTQIPCRQTTGNAAAAASARAAATRQKYGL